MEPRNKKKMKTQKNEEKSNFDRLSCLPDSILCHILSFLDTKSAIHTSLLSKRYKFLWTQLQNLDFELSEVPYRSLKSYHVDGFPKPYLKPSVYTFEEFVNYVLSSREETNLTTFRLSMHHLVEPEFVEAWLDYAADHNVQHLIIRAIVKRKHVALPKLLLNSSSLITLHLTNATCYSIELPKSVLLPNLKVLRLKNFKFCDENYNGDVFSGCPCLETLVLSKCCIKPGEKLKVIDVNCLKLKNLEIRYWRSPWCYFDEFMINVNAPELVYFRFQGHLARVNFKKGMPCLDTVHVELCYPSSCAEVNVSERKQKTSESFISMLHQLHNVKFLSLSMMTVEVVAANTELALLPSTFENLRFIKFTTDDKYLEMKIPIMDVRWLLNEDIWILDVPKELLKVLKIKRKDISPICLPSNAVHYLLESSPAAELLCIEIPKLSPD
ncbi:hypothetical protein ACJIZ3_003027 [Penstemon smallii]|uniref:F-box domain-containing protein n=1 Tax=Penstemon smallii TaxID=265156 RepID=A0ABD3U813_9LAMI